MPDAKKIALTCGDVNGIGPEIIRKALLSPGIADLAEYSLFAPAVITDYFAGLSLRIVDTGPENVEIVPGKWSTRSGEAAFRSIETAVSETLKGNFAAVVTAPICKQAVIAAGHQFPGHTEMLKQMCGVDDVIMLFLSDKMIIGLLTTHLPLSAVPSVLTKDYILRKIVLLDRELKNRFAASHPQIALCALNPHAGEGGIFGREEINHFIPAAETARQMGIEVSDPLPADALFLRADKWDAILAAYHDQGLIPAKTVPGGSVNYTGGLPIIRTSPDHGTAFDIAGQDIADPAPMVQAIRWAVKLSAGIGH